MYIKSKILFFVLCLCITFLSLSATSKPYYYNSQPNLDSLIKENNVNNDMTKLELLILYHHAWSKKHKDSVNIFKNLALLNAELEQPKDAFFFTEKYINNTLDFSILEDKSYLNIAKSEEFKSLSDKYLIKYDFLSFLYLYVSMIGFFFMIIINFTKKGNKTSKMFIGSFVGAHSLFILEFALYISNIQYKLPHTYLMASTVALLYGPFLYFYFKNITENKALCKLDLLHLLPTVVLLIFLFPLYSSEASEKLKMLLDMDNTSKIFTKTIFISKIISLVVYGYLIGALYNKKHKEMLDNPGNYSIDSWMKTIYRIHIAYIISYVVYGISANGSFGYISHFVFHAQAGIMSIMVLYIAYMAYVQPNVFSNGYVSIPGSLFFEKYKKSGLTESLSSELKECLIKLFTEEKIFKESNINLEILSSRLNTTRHNTSQIINEHFEMNFFELVNKFRINEAINIIKHDICGSLNIIDIAYEVGYNNKVTFNKAFKKETSMTPSEFISSLQAKTIK